MDIHTFYTVAMIIALILLVLICLGVFRKPMQSSNPGCVVYGSMILQDQQMYQLSYDFSKNKTIVVPFEATEGRKTSFGSEARALRAFDTLLGVVEGHDAIYFRLTVLKANPDTMEFEVIRELGSARTTLKQKRERVDEDINEVNIID